MRKKIIVTGATSGIGKATVEALANEDNHLILGCRNLPKTEKIVDDLKAMNNDVKIDIYVLDLASFESIKDFAKTINTSYDAIDILVNNAGVFSDKKAYTKEGFELTVGVNYIGTYYLTTLLLPLISKGHNPQIINICSRAALFGKFTLKENAFVKQSHGFRGYSASKYLQLTSTIYMAETLNNNIKMNAVHPGDAATGIWKGDSLLMKLVGPIMKKALSSSEDAAKAGLYLIENTPDKSGLLYEKEGVVIEHTKYDKSFAESLIRETDQLIDKSSKSK